MKLRISASVGKNGKNQAEDVKLVKALLNAYFRVKDKAKVMKLDSTASESLITAITSFQTDHQKLSKADGQVTSVNSKSFKSLISFLKTTRTIKAITPPVKGIITWDAEGKEGTFLHSRVLHVPTAASGLTLGRGYDLKERSETEVKADLISVGVNQSDAMVIAKAVGLEGDEAHKFIYRNDLLDFEISPEGQLKLFKIAYVEKEKVVKRICTKPNAKARAKYGVVSSWDKLNPAILEVLIDLCFRGDYHGESRKKIQKLVVKNDFNGFKDVITNKANWPGWPIDRFNRRKNYLVRVAAGRVGKGIAA